MDRNLENIAVHDDDNNKSLFYFSQDKYIKKFRFKFFEFLTMIEEPGKVRKSRISNRIAAHHIQQIEKYCVEKNNNFHAIHKCTFKHGAK